MNLIIVAGNKRKIHCSCKNGTLCLIVVISKDIRADYLNMIALGDSSSLSRLIRNLSDDEAARASAFLSQGDVIDQNNSYKCGR